jgi:hypothetical protein
MPFPGPSPPTYRSAPDTRGQRAVPQLRLGQRSLVGVRAPARRHRHHDSSVVVVHYADLEEGLAGEVRRIAERLRIDVSEDRIAHIVEASSFDSMRARAGTLLPNAGQIWVDEQAFFRSGTSGQWREVVGEEADVRYQRLVRELIDDDDELLAWLHRP